MSLTLYDRAVTEKIKKWVLDDKMNVLGPDETRRRFSMQADMTDDKPIQLPLITINRQPDINVRDIGKRPMTWMGKVFNNENGISDHLNAVPVSINYVLNIYTRYLEEADEYVRNFAFNLINHPSIKILIPYNDSNLAYTSFLTFSNEITDNSDIPERLIAGQFTRFTMRFSLNDAYLFSYNHRYVPQIIGTELQIVIKDSSKDTVDTIVDTDEFKIQIIV